MKKITCLLASVLIATSFIGHAEETEQTIDDNFTTAYISDDLFIYMHAGPGNNYRILGSINAGDEIKLTGKQENGYYQIIDTKERATWVEAKYVSTKPGLRVMIAELNTKLADSEDINLQTTSDLATANREIVKLSEQTKQLNQQISQLTQELTETTSQLSTQDMAIKKEYFFNGAIVLGIGLLFGLILPRLAARKKSSMDSWK
ncbi:signal transduction protein [Thalassotalea insulae]|uniref:Signal transduction protein n=1 Tax=Thalassotalea insulae TaxID=2056778 RepID=A0ABQ6GUE0_9GAMM|nr:TIGR04211 family SH3 domain-containing protein [Thalassotalea insulae]GLX79556.1 signal transduction protein [Thalassotalea insulae]